MRRNMIKRYTAMVLICLMITPLLAVSASAADTPVITAFSVNATRGQMAQVIISLDGNPGIWSMGLKVGYDHNALTLTNYSAGSIFTSSEVTEPPALDKAAFFFLASKKNVENTNKKVTLVTLTFLVNKAAEYKDYPITLELSRDNTINIKGEEVVFSTVNGKITVTESSGGGQDTSPIAAPATTPAQTTVRKANLVLIQENGDRKATSVSVDVTRKKEGNKTTDTLALAENTIQDILKIYGASGMDTLSLVLEDLPGGEADEVELNLPKNTIQLLSGEEISLKIQTSGATIELLKEELKKLAMKDQDIYFNISPLEDKEEQKSINESTLNLAVARSYVTSEAAEICGRTMVIESNYSGQKAKISLPLEGITLPADPKERTNFIKNLVVLVNHSDGEAELLTGKLINDAEGNPAAIEIQVSKFSTFTIITSTNAKPVASRLTITGKRTVGAKLTGSYRYSDADKDAKGTAVYRWYRADSAGGKNKTKIAGATKSSYQVTAKDQGKYLILVVTPKAKTGILVGKSITKAVKVPAKK